MNCSFCCKILLKEESCQNNEDDLCDLNPIKVTKEDSYERKLNRGANERNILLISRYVKLSTNEITKAKELGTLSTLHFCEECDSLSGKLGELCGLLEITQMKVNYYLKLLTENILQMDDDTVKQQNFSSFQRIFHKKCLTKAYKMDPNPVLKITKCISPTVEDGMDIFEEEPENRKYLRCTYCSKTVRDKNMSKHEVICAKKLGKQVKKQNSGELDKFECSNCKEKFKEQVDMLYHIQNFCMAGEVISPYGIHKTLNSLSKKATPKPRGPWYYRTTKCEYCDKTVFTRTLQRHVYQVHLTRNKVKRRKCGYGCGLSIANSRRRRHMLEAHHVEITDKEYRCLVCNNLYSQSQNWRRHLGRSKKCGVAVYGGLKMINKVKKGKVRVKELKIVKEEKNLMSENDTSDSDRADLVVNGDDDEQMCREKDPLSIVSEIL